jgi:transposase-like protein
MASRRLIARGPSSPVQHRSAGAARGSDDAPTRRRRGQWRWTARRAPAAVGRLRRRRAERTPLPHGACAANPAGGAAALETFAERWDRRYPAIVRLWRSHWDESTPFLAFTPEVRRVIYTTNLIESINARLRKVTRNRGQFPSEQAVLKVLYLAVRNLEEFRQPNVGIRSSGWKQALQAFTIYFQGRIPTP